MSISAFRNFSKEKYKGKDQTCIHVCKGNSLFRSLLGHIFLYCNNTDCLINKNVASISNTAYSL